ncbi:MAG: isoleucine--tRNA ligase [Gemmatimonadota bacterium]
MNRPAKYPDVPSTLLALEEEILEHWRDEDLFRQTLAATEGGEPFVFYEGPPTANGRPGLHHVISRTIKDLVCRHRTMQGRSVTRIAGWDTHGLPVEIEAERKLGISGKPEIEKVGIAKFNEVCRDSVFTYTEEWERLSERIAYWLDYSRPYVTYHTEYIESVWWILKELAGKGLLYRGQKSVPYCPRCGTALSSHEVAQGYKDVDDPSLYFLCDWLDDAGAAPDPEGRSFLVWTTTPWTVPSNTALAVHEELSYAEVAWEGRRLVLAEARVTEIFGEEVEILRRYRGSELVGRRYRRPLDLIALTDDEAARGWRVVSEDFVSADDGSGIVHLAPAFGADDYAAGRRHDFPLLRPVDDRGCFREEIPVIGGVFVKDADPVLLDALEAAGMLFRVDSVRHSYPHCWRCDSPLIYMARDSWFAATSTRKAEMLEINRQIGWHPPEVGEGRFGEWLANNVDWALSRDRFWGTPLPVWVCDADPEHSEWIGSVAELAERAGPLPDGFDPHRPFIDEVTWECASCAGTMRRDPVVLDVWFDSGAMPYAQWHWPHENEEEFRAHFPADFICEALDQTRGWFYSLLAIGTMLDMGPVFRNVIVNGLILDADGQKMSKSKGNTVDPWEAIAEFGADPLRWYLITASNPWVPKRYDPEGVRESARRLFDTVLNTYRFFALYGNVEAWTPSDEDPAPEERSVLDRWLLSRLDATIAGVGEELEGYQLTRAYRLVLDFVNEDLSNWYVRRSRPRFWGNTDTHDARSAFRTLWEALIGVAQMTAPVVPFFADWLHRSLDEGRSVHLASFPTPEAGRRDPALEAEMEGVRALVSLGRAAREEVRIRVRQPLRTLYSVLPGGLRPRAELLALLKDELNVKEVRFLDSAEELVRLSARPNFRALGPRFQKESEAAATAIRALDSSALRAMQAGEAVSIEVGGVSVPLEAEWFEFAEEAAGELVVKSEQGFTAALDPALDAELRTEGMARELVNRIQRLRKDAGLEITDRIRIGIGGPEEVQVAVARFREFIARETLALEVLAVAERPDGYEADVEDEIDGVPVQLALRRDS